ncbi:MAG: hypothetical protein C4292_03045 [Nitrososphaera sp.]
MLFQTVALKSLDLPEGQEWESLFDARRTKIPIWGLTYESERYDCGAPFTDKIFNAMQMWLVASVGRIIARLTFDFNS